MIEVVVGTALALVLTAAAFSFATQQSRMLGVTTATMSMGQSARASLDLLVEDLRHAGVGTGYLPDGTFSGILSGDYSAGGVSFDSTDRTLTLSTGPTVTDDLGVRMADGAYGTIADWSLAGGAQLCAGSGLEAGALAFVRTEEGLAGRTVLVQSIAPAAACTTGRCLGGCEVITWVASPSFLTEASAATASYLGGELAAGFKTVVWFVEADDPARVGLGALRRAVFDHVRGCAARDHRCGELVTEGVDTLQIAVWEWDADDARWIDATSGTPAPYARLRVDLELVLRARTADDRPHEPVRLQLAPGRCAPDCSGVTDGVPRRVVRTSTELRNSGRTRIR